MDDAARIGNSRAKHRGGQRADAPFRREQRRDDRAGGAGRQAEPAVHALIDQRRIRRVMRVERAGLHTNRPGFNVIFGSNSRRTAPMRLIAISCLIALRTFPGGSAASRRLSPCSLAALSGHTPKSSAEARYWFQTQNLAVDDIQTPVADPFTGMPLLNPAGAPTRGNVRRLDFAGGLYGAL